MRKEQSISSFKNGYATITVSSSSTNITSNDNTLESYIEEVRKERQNTRSHSRNKTARFREKLNSIGNA